MRESRDTFHLAIPARDLEEAEAFYVGGLGCHLARRYTDRITINFFGDQVVCHLSDRWEREIDSIYPRHFGITFRDAAEFQHVQRLTELRELAIHSPVATRFAGTPEEHLTFVISDPSNNLIEFKHYHDPRMMH